MKLRTILVAAIALVSGLLLSNSHVGRVYADDQHDRACSTKTLHGSYGFYRSGTTSTGPLTAVGMLSMVAGNAVFGVAKKIHSSDDDR